MPTPSDYCNPFRSISWFSVFILLSGLAEATEGPAKCPLGEVWLNTEVNLKNAVDSHHRKTVYPLYLHKVPEQHRAHSGNPWDSLERGSGCGRKKSPIRSTLRRRLRADGTNYRSILDHMRRQRCTAMLEKGGCPASVWRGSSATLR